MKSVLTSDRCKLKHFSWRFCRSDASFKIPALFGHLQSNLDHKVEWVSTSGYCTVFVQAGLAKNCVIRDDLEDHYWTRDLRRMSTVEQMAELVGPWTMGCSSVYHQKKPAESLVKADEDSVKGGNGYNTYRSRTVTSTEIFYLVIIYKSDSF